MEVEIKQLIFDAFENNIKYIDNNGKEVNPLKGPDSNKAKSKITTLANELGDAIVRWVEDQKFTITNSEQSGLTTPMTLPVVTPAGPGSVIIPSHNVTTSQKDSKKGPSPSNIMAAAESSKSTVQLINTSGNRNV